MSTPKNPLELVDRYLQAVRFWLPKTRRQEDLLAELGDDLRSQIEDRESELHRPLDKGEISEILKRCGTPMVVASQLGPKRYLIGPTLFPIYQFVLKMVLLWILVPVFFLIVGLVNLANSNGDWGKAVTATLGGLWSGSFVAAGVITLMFAILERTNVITEITCKWDPERLPPLEKTGQKTSLFQTICELTFNVFGMVWLLLIPNHPFLVLGPACAFLIAGPIWATFYVWLVLLAAAVTVRCAIILVRPQWKGFSISSKVVQAVLTMILINAMIHAAGHNGAADWHPFVAVAPGLLGSEKYTQLTKIAAVVNISILISLVCTWIGVGISGAVQTWELLKYMRKQRISGEAASVQVL